MMRNFLLCIFLVSAVSACVEDPPVEISGEALLRSRFIPVDSINKLELRQSLNSQLIDDVSDDLDYIDSLENAGDPGDYTEEKLILNASLDSLEDAGSLLRTQISQLNQGTILLDFVSALGTEKEIRYETPRSLYGLPLRSDALEVTFLIGYGDYLEEATVSYQLESLFDERIVRQRGYDLNLVNYTFDSVKVQCTADTCTTDEILYTFYF